MQTPKDVFLDFINQMKNWEIEQTQAFKKYGANYIVGEEFSKIMRQKLIDIQEKFLSQKALSLQQGRRLSMNFGEPPEYDQVMISENLINSKKCEITSSQNGDDDLKYRYTLVLENNLWKIDKVAHSWMKWRASRQLF